MATVALLRQQRIRREDDSPVGRLFEFPGVIDGAAVVAVLQVTLQVLEEARFGDVDGATCYAAG